MKSYKDQLLGALIGLARASESKEISTSAGDAFVRGLAMVKVLSDSSESPDNSQILAMVNCLHKEKALMAPDCAACQYPCGRTFDYEMEEIYDASEMLRIAKLQLLELLETIASHPSANASNENRQFLSDALFQISCTYTPDQLEPLIHKANQIIQSHMDV